METTVKILNYDPGKGKGYYKTLDGKMVGFRYRQFGGGPMMAPGTIAVLENDFLLTAKSGINKPIFAIRRLLSWLS